MNNIHRIQEASDRPEALTSKGLDILEPSQRKRVAQTLADVLTLSDAEGMALLDSHPEEAYCAYLAFTVELASREWRSHTMAALPYESWVLKDASAQDSPFQVEEPDANFATLKYISARRELDEEERKHLGTRKKLHELLLNAIRAKTEAYSPVLDWYDPESAEQPYRADAHLIVLIETIEQLFYAGYKNFEKGVRQAMGWGPERDGTPTPYRFTNDIAKAAAEQVLRAVRWRNEEESPPFSRKTGFAGEGPFPRKDELIFQLMANVTANRHLLELSRVNVITRVGANHLLKFLRALNAAGITETPATLPAQCTDDDIKAILSFWFGAEGTLNIRRRTGERYVLKGDQLEVVVGISKKIHQEFLRTNGQVRDSDAQYTSSDDKFLFALAVVACDYVKAKVPDEFQRSQERMVVPGQSKGKGAKERMNPTKEATLLVQKMYGQLLYGNPGTSLLHDEVQTYAHSQEYKRAHLQQLIFGMFKRGTPEQLLDWFNQVEEMREKELARKRTAQFLLGDENLASKINWDNQSPVPSR